SQSACFAHEGHLRVTLVSRNARFAHEGRLRVTLVSQNACFAHEGRPRVTLVSRNARFAHEGRLRVTLVFAREPKRLFCSRRAWHLVHIRLLTYFTGVLSWLLAAVPMNEYSLANIFVKIIRDKWELLLRKWLFFAKCFFCW
uniref:hypothetical protein n=1 Tax=Candidatus Cryptobacteroides bacterium TaxID=3085639 RepID=UPI004029FFD7